MSVTMCVFCDSMVDTDWHDCCPSCERCPFGEYMFCGTCLHYVEPTSELLIAKTGDMASCALHNKAVDCDTESCGDYEDAEYTHG